MSEPQGRNATHVTLSRGEPGPDGRQWVQVPRRSMEALAVLMGRSPSAAKLLMQMTARMGNHNAFIASNKALCDLTGLSLATVKRSLAILQDGRWISILRLGPTGTVRAIIINDQVAWHGPREGLRHSLFSAAVLVSEEEQDAAELARNSTQPMEIPAIYRGEMQLPTGDGLPPPTQPPLTGLEPDLPARRSQPLQTDLEDWTGLPKRGRGDA